MRTVVFTSQMLTRQDGRRTDGRSLAEQSSEERDVAQEWNLGRRSLLPMAKNKAYKGVLVKLTADALNNLCFDTEIHADVRDPIIIRHCLQCCFMRSSLAAVEKVVPCQGIHRHPMTAFGRRGAST